MRPSNANVSTPPKSRTQPLARVTDPQRHVAPAPAPEWSGNTCASFPPESATTGEKKTSAGRRAAVASRTTSENVAFADSQFCFSAPMSVIGALPWGSVT